MDTDTGPSKGLIDLVGHERASQLHRIGLAAEKVGKARIALEAAKQELQEEMKS